MITGKSTWIRGCSRITMPCNEKDVTKVRMSHRNALKNQATNDLLYDWQWTDTQDDQIIQVLQQTDWKTLCESAAPEAIFDKRTLSTKIRTTFLGESYWQSSNQGTGHRTKETPLLVSQTGNVWKMAAARGAASPSSVRTLAENRKSTCTACLVQTMSKKKS